jgi:PQQ-dependent dehydrogenase (s-GDH family)
MKIKVALALMLAAVVPAAAQDTPESVVPGTVPFEMKILTTNLQAPWELTHGPDGFLWVTERTGGQITRVDPANGTKTVAIKFADSFSPGGQDGLLGLALHPELLKGTGNDYVYAAYTYKDRMRLPDETVGDIFSAYRFLFTKIVRLTFDQATGTLKDPMIVIEGMPASNDHNSGRLKIGPDGKLFYTIGDGGNDQLGNWCLPILAQLLPTAAQVAARDWWSYQGKSLRLNLDGSIPEDNPEINGVRSHVYTYGHRNMQGIDFAPNGLLYASEQGPKTDDEVNILEPGKNYGWPHVAGFIDNKAYQYARWHDSVEPPCRELEFSDIELEPSVPRADETEYTEEIVEPLATMFTVPSDWNFEDGRCRGINFICWPTVAPSSIEAYMPEAGQGVPGWENSLITTTLKRGSLYRLPLSADGRSLSGPIERYFQSENRFRDIALSPDMKTIYVATDISGLAESLDGGVTQQMKNPGSILVFTYAEEGATASPAGDAGAAGDVGRAAVDVATIEGVPPMFTTGQAERGKRVYDSNCVSCHGPNLVNAQYGTPLSGQYFADHWTGKTVLELYTKTRDTMPPSRPATFDDQTYADLVAYILNGNAQVPGGSDLRPDRAAMEEMIIGKQ